jgi:hypothetical protein
MRYGEHLWCGEADGEGGEDTASRFIMGSLEQVSFAMKEGVVYKMNSAPVPVS